MNTLRASRGTLLAPPIWIIHIIRWAARIGSVASAALLAAFLFGESRTLTPTPTPTEAIALALFPGGVVIGMAIGWWREGLGGAVTVMSLAAFHFWMTILDGHVLHGPYFALFAAPGFLFLAAWALRRRHVANST
jgi:hypothetical protein